MSQPKIDINATTVKGKLNYVSIVTNEGQTPLEIAVYNNSLEVARQLIDAGASLSSPTLAHSAIKGATFHASDYENMFRLLLSHNCSFGNLDSKGRTPLLLALEKGIDVSSIELLLDIPSCQQSINVIYKGFTGNIPYLAI
jgi:ankyrin repeat protein